MLHTTSGRTVDDTDGGDGKLSCRCSRSACTRCSAERGDCSRALGAASSRARSRCDTDDAVVSELYLRALPHQDGPAGPVSPRSAPAVYQGKSTYPVASMPLPRRVVGTLELGVPPLSVVGKLPPNAPIHNPLPSKSPELACMRHTCDAGPYLPWRAGRGGDSFGSMAGAYHLPSGALCVCVCDNDAARMMVEAESA